MTKTRRSFLSFLAASPLIGWGVVKGFQDSDLKLYAGGATYVDPPMIAVEDVMQNDSVLWLRDENGEWVLERFTISSFEVLRDEPLSAVVARLRDVPGGEWPDLDDPWGELDRIRNGPAEAN